MRSTFVCEKCLGTFNRPLGWTHTGALAKHDAVFPESVGNPVAEVCQSCYDKFMAWFNGLSDKVRDGMKNEARAGFPLTPKDQPCQRHK